MKPKALHIPKVKPATKDKPDKHPLKQFANKNIPLESIIQYTKQGLSDPEMAKLLNCHPSNISRRRTEEGYNPNKAKHFQDTELDINRHKRAMLLNSITEEEVKKMSVHNRVVDYGILYDKEMLKRSGIQTIAGNVILNLIYRSNKGNKVGDNIINQAQSEAIEVSATPLLECVDSNTVNTLHNVDDNSK